MLKNSCVTSVVPLGPADLPPCRPMPWPREYTPRSRLRSQMRPANAAPQTEADLQGGYGYSLPFRD